MIVGNGNIARVLQDREGALFFASGVSNSQLPNESPAFRREKEMLMMYTKLPLTIFYFSTISIFYKESPYTNHKKRMESFIRSNWNNYNIIRIGNIEWDTNPNTFVNALKAKKAAGEIFTVLNEWRYMIDKETLLTLTQSLPLIGQHEINVFSKMGKPESFL